MGAGRHFKLDLKNRFVMLLVYHRLYITYALAGFLFDLDQSNICRDIQKIESLIRKCLPTTQKIYNITKRLRTPDRVEKYFPGFLAFIDSTEQQIPRPESKERRQIFYLGKKKRHAVKNQIIPISICSLKSNSFNILYMICMICYISLPIIKERR